MLSVILVTAVAGGKNGATLVEVLFPPLRPIALVLVATGKLAAEVGGVLLGGRVTTLKFKEVGELKFTSVKTPKLPITRVLLFRVFS